MQPEIGPAIMTPNAYLLVIVGAAWLAYFQILRKREVGAWKGKDATFTAAYLLIASAALFIISVMTGGPQIMESGSWRENFWLAAIVTGVLNIGFQIFSVKANRLADTSLVTPYLATTPAIVILTSAAILHEWPSKMGYMGLVLLILGAYIINIESYLAKRKAEERNWKDAFAPFTALKYNSGVRFALGAALIGSVSLNFDGIAARTANVPFAFGVVMMIAGVGSLVVAMFLREWIIVIQPSAAFYLGEGRYSPVPTSDAPKPTVPSKRISRVLWMAFWYAGAIWLMSLANRESIVPYVGSMKRIQIPFNAILAIWLLKESVTKARFIGGIVMALGAAAMGLQDQLLYDAIAVVRSVFQ